MYLGKPVTQEVARWTLLTNLLDDEMSAYQVAL